MTWELDRPPLPLQGTRVRTGRLVATRKEAERKRTPYVRPGPAQTRPISCPSSFSRLCSDWADQVGGASFRSSTTCTFFFLPGGGLESRGGGPPGRFGRHRRRSLMEVDILPADRRR